jgi:hypothetical protein
VMAQQVSCGPFISETQMETWWKSVIVCNAPATGGSAREI